MSDDARPRPWHPEEREAIVRALAAGFHRLHPHADPGTHAAQLYIRAVDGDHTDFLYLSPGRGDTFVCRARHVEPGKTETVRQKSGRVVETLDAALAWPDE